MIHIGRVLVIEFNNQESHIFDEVMDVLKRYPDFDPMQVRDEAVLDVPGLEFYPYRRKVYCNQREISLTAKEYELFALLVKNEGRVLTYGRLYQAVWGDSVIGNENNAVKCHIRNLRRKLHEASADICFTIKCVREVGYCFELNTQ